MEAETAIGPISEEDQLRAHFYGLLSRLLITKPDDGLLSMLQGLDGDETDIGKALGDIGRLARDARLEDIDDEYGELFHGYGAGGELIPCASFYMTGFVYEKPLTRLRATMSMLGMEKSQDFKEPEDSIGFVLEAMHGLITGAFDGPRDLAEQKAFFDAHIDPWARRFFEDLEQAEVAHFYRPVGRLGYLFLGIEKEAFSMSD